MCMHVYITAGAIIEIELLRSMHKSLSAVYATVVLQVIVIFTSHEYSIIVTFTTDHFKLHLLNVRNG